MSERKENFHDFSIKSVLFKGHRDWYFCFLKSERLAQVLNLFAEKFQKPPTENLLIEATKLPQSILYFVAGEVQLPLLLAEIISITSMLRIVGTTQRIPEEHLAIIISEYEALAEKIGGGAHPSPFVSSGDFNVETSFVEERNEGLLLGHSSESFKGHNTDSLKDISKGQNNLERRTSKEQKERTKKIFEFVRDNNGVSISEIAKVVRNCSEKTIQRELSFLIRQGMVKKFGERRWSIYRATENGNG